MKQNTKGNDFVMQQNGNRNKESCFQIQIQHVPKQDNLCFRTPLTLYQGWDTYVPVS